MRRLCAAIILLAVIIPGLPATVNVADVAAAPAKANIAWSTCYRQFGPFECGTVQVPLDYDSPNGATISIAVVRLPATDPERRVRSSDSENR